MSNPVRWSITLSLLLIVAINALIRMHIMHKGHTQTHEYSNRRNTAPNQEMTVWMKSQSPAVVNEAFYHPVEYNSKTATVIGDRTIENSGFYIEFICSDAGSAIYLMETPMPDTIPSPYWTKRITTQDGAELKYNQVVKGYLLNSRHVKADLHLKVYTGDDKNEHADDLVIKTELTRSLIYATCTALIKNGLTVDDQWLL
jgi:hypothetical protein